MRNICEINCGTTCQFILYRYTLCMTTGHYTLANAKQGSISYKYTFVNTDLFGYNHVKYLTYVSNYDLHIWQFGKVVIFRIECTFVGIIWHYKRRLGDRSNSCDNNFLWPRNCQSFRLFYSIIPQSIYFLDCHLNSILIWQVIKIMFNNPINLAFHSNKLRRRKGLTIQYRS